MSVLNHQSLPEFFREKVNDSKENLNLNISPQAEFYVVHLLSNFANVENYFEKNENGNLEDRALALRLFDSVSQTPTTSISVLKKMGDVALYTSGFFQDSLYKKIVNLDYYLQMGSIAYSHVSKLVGSRISSADTKDLFDELAENFCQLVELLSFIAHNSGYKSDKDILKMYERWLLTGSQTAEQTLKENGIMPLEMAKSKFKQ